MEDLHPYLVRDQIDEQKNSIRRLRLTTQAKDAIDKLEKEGIAFKSNECLEALKSITEYLTTLTDILQRFLQS